MKIALIGFLGLLVSLVLVEIGLRLAFGFGNPPLYQADDEIGYLLAPNQRLRRFGNRIEINQYSMRTGPIAAQRPAQGLRVFLVGDSIVNGNWWTDQSHTLSALLERALQERLPAPWRTLEVLNASANSWGPRNQQAYLQRFGTFESQILVLVLNTDDLFGTAPTSVQVGRDRNYPDRSFGLAIAEIWHRYLKKQPSIPELKALQQEGGDRVGLNLDAVQQIRQQVETSGGQMLLVMTPLKREVLPPGPRDYELKARQRVKDFAKSQQLAYLDFLTPFQQVAGPESLYRDHIHLSPQGNALVKDTLLEAIPSHLADKRDRGR